MYMCVHTCTCTDTHLSTGLLLLRCLKKELAPYFQTWAEWSPDTEQQSSSVGWKESPLTEPPWAVYFRTGCPVSTSHRKAMPSELGQDEKIHVSQDRTDRHYYRKAMPSESGLDKEISQDRTKLSIDTIGRPCHLSQDRTELLIDTK